MNHLKDMAVKKLFDWHKAAVVAAKIKAPGS
jgi:hypothetical protein